MECGGVLGEVGVGVGVCIERHDLLLCLWQFARTISPPSSLSCEIDPS